MVTKHTEAEPKQGRQCTCNVILRRVPTTVFAVKKTQSITYRECVSQCACAEIYSHLWPARLYSIVPHYLINGTIFEKKKKLLNIKLF